MQRPHGNRAECAPLMAWVPIALAGIGLNLWILWYLLVKWPGAWGQPLPLLGWVFCGIAALLLAGLLYTILNAMFRSSPRKIGG
jgi:hypothetical protein